MPTNTRNHESLKEIIGADSPILDKEGLRQKLGLPSTRGVDELVRRRKIPVIRLGHRTVRFSWPRVQQALERLTVREVGA